MSSWAGPRAPLRSPASRSWARRRPSTATVMPAARGRRRARSLEQHAGRAHVANPVEPADIGGDGQTDSPFGHTAEQQFVLQVVQPGLAGLMDGSVSTLAPLFATAFATNSSRDAFLVGLAASVGAGISMGFAEALSDDGSLTGRGRPLVRGVITGVMTTAGGIGHTLPFLT